MCLSEAEDRACKALLRYTATRRSGDPNELSDSYVELSSSVSDLFSVHLKDAGWKDGWLDGGPFHTLAETSDRAVRYSGLLVWGDEHGAFWLGPFHAVFQLRDSAESFRSYQSLFQSNRKDRQPIRYARELACVSLQIAIPDASEPVDAREWKYAFAKGK